MNSARREQTLKSKRDEYFGYVEMYFHTRHDEAYEKIFRQVRLLLIIINYQTDSY
jgi:hypothetical protein